MLLCPMRSDAQRSTRGWYCSLLLCPMRCHARLSTLCAHRVTTWVTASCRAKVGVGFGLGLGLGLELGLGLGFGFELAYTAADSSWQVLRSHHTSTACSHAALLPKQQRRRFSWHASLEQDDLARAWARVRVWATTYPPCLRPFAHGRVPGPARGVLHGQPDCNVKLVWCMQAICMGAVVRLQFPLTTPL